MDYSFIGDNLEDDLLDDQSDEKKKGKLPVLVVYDNCKEAFWTLLVSQKGPAGSVVKWSIGRLEDFGYIGESITTKSDQEESIVALRKAIPAARVGDTVPINSPVWCSKSNGKIERAVRSFHGQLWVLKFHFEKGIKRQMPSSCAMLSWLATCTSEVLN